jgi:hypothetical protein
MKTEEDCPYCEYQKKLAQLWRHEAYKLSGHPFDWEPELMMRKEWVGLNGADWNDFNPLLVNDPHRIAEWVERILKDKNT